MTAEDDFQAALDADPDAHHLRLVFADWLEESGDPRAEGYRALGVSRVRPVSAGVFHRPGYLSGDALDEMADRAIGPGTIQYEAGGGDFGRRGERPKTRSRSRSPRFRLPAGPNCSGARRACERGATTRRGAVASHLERGYPHPVLVVPFSSWVSHRPMLRRPSLCQPIPRGDGCSSTAFGSCSSTCATVWDNLAGRGSVAQVLEQLPAVP